MGGRRVELIFFLAERGVSGAVASSISPWEVREVTLWALSSSDAKDELVKGSMPGAQ